MEVTNTLWLAVGIGGVAVFCLVFWFRGRSKKQTTVGRAESEAVFVSRKDEPAARVAPAPPKEKPLRDRLSQTRGAFVDRLGGLFGRSSVSELQNAEWQQIEETLLAGDVGVVTTKKLLAQMRSRLKQGNGIGLKELLREESEGLLSGLPHGFLSSCASAKPLVMSIVGVNGAGKTTTIGKLASRFSSDGKTVLMGAGDTFRAAAIQQLKVWADRVGCQFVAGKEGGDPGAVAFDAVSAGKARGVDVVLLDTAGRLHTKSNLMDELKKVHRVVKKVIPDAPHETWIVVDGTNGQNAVHQVREFHSALSLTGVIVTKLDGTARGGAIFSIANELRLPIKFIGVGESVADLLPFDPKAFVEAILN